MQHTAHVSLPVVAERQAHGGHDKDEHEHGVVMEGDHTQGGHNDQEHGEGIAAMIKQLPHGCVGVGAASLLPVDGIQ